ncbi:MULTISPECIES: cyclic nucleotide-binding domain-containing protein [unclassified Thioalkalivibrio]|uniref:cyclic nucleotide-binding domain-containing protein n=1 Tax=unclassified Thioalkalivibrio TaxID=2621013 RepID=UPI00037EA444|nr:MULTISPECIES: cyclic nucleotide-binding domain-containing protein [unclassified Thioalkalivibrio]
MKELLAILEEQPFFEDMDERHRRLLAACAAERSYAAGAILMRDHEPTETFWLIREGQVALEGRLREGNVPFMTLGPGDILGWSWLLPPYRASYDARATTDLHTLRFDAGVLRERMEADPALGYTLMKHFAALIVQRLQAARLQALDIYSHGGPGHGT